jgi:sugar phosphate isomerase/epimerase
VRLGVSTSCFGQVSLPEALRWAGECGFQSVEIAAPPLRISSWFEHTALHVGGLDGAARDAFLSALDKFGLRAAAIGWRGNLLDPDLERREAALAHLARMVEAAATLGIPIVTCQVGRDPATTLGNSIAEFARRVRPVADQAAGSGVRLAVENSPMVGRDVEDAPSSAAFAPELWEKLFTHLRSPAVGLAMNPGDLAWTGIDPVAAVTDYAEKVFHIHAEDVEMLDLRRQDCSVLRPSGGWWRHRLPGLGSIDWRRFIDRLHELGYGGALAVRHEDAVWQGSLDKIKTGLSLARRHLVQFLP